MPDIDTEQFAPRPAPAVNGRDGSTFLLPDRHSELIKSAESARAAHIPYRLNPTLYGFGAYEGVKDLPGALLTTNNILRQIPSRNPVVAGILRRRQNQAGNWSRLPRFDKDTGFRVGMRQKDKRPNAAAKKKMREIEDILLYGGVRTQHPRTNQWGVWDAEGSSRAKGIARATRALVGDSLTLDAAAVRVQPGMNAVRYPVAFWDPVDAALVRYAIPRDHGKDAVAGWGMGGANSAAYRAQVRPDMKDVAFVCVNSQGQGITAEYAWNEMGYLVRNPRTDEWVMGYGFSELEQLISVITGLLYGISYNTEFFDANHVPPGILAMPGEYGDDALKDMRLQLRMMCGGPGQFWTLPILGKGLNQGSMDYVPLRQGDNGGMYWKEWILFCANVAAALYGMDPSEINMTAFGASSNALANPAPENKISYAQESGLEPVLGDLSAFFDETIVQVCEPDFVFEYTGLSDPDAATEMQQSQYRVSFLGSTPNMERAILDKRPIVDPIDRALWDTCLAAAKKSAGDSADTDEVEEATVAAYKKGGGQLAQWPDAPVDCPGALQIWQIEHNLQAPAPMGMPGEGGQPGSEGGEGDEGDAGAPGEQDFPAAPAKKPAPGPAEKLGDDTHINDAGAMLLRRGAAAKQPPMLKKSIFEVVVRRRPGEPQ